MSDEAYDVALGVLRGFTMGEEVGSQALAVVESQNQALQREVENKAAILNAIEALLDVDDEHTGWDRIVALQERAEKAEAALREALSYTENNSLNGYNADETLEAIAWGIRNALSPTQETDPE